MVSTAPQPTALHANKWVQASWDEFSKTWDESELMKGSFYFFELQMRIEMSPIGSAHSQDDSLLSRLVNLYATLKCIRYKEFSNCSFRKSGKFEFQPDIAIYVGDDTRFPPRSTSPVDLNENEPPTLVIEVASTSLNDDLGRKRLLYEQVGIREYWVIDVKANQAIAFEILEKGRSGRIQTSLVLPGLELPVVEEALRRSHSEDDSTVNRWLLDLFSPKN